MFAMQETQNPKTTEVVTCGDNNDTGKAVEQKKSDTQSKKEVFEKMLSDDKKKEIPNKDKDDDRFQFIPIESLNFKRTPIRNQEFYRFRQILQAPHINVPLLVVERQEDILPLLSIYAHRQKLKGRTSFFSVTPGDFQMDYGDPDVPFDARHNLDMGATILEESDLNTQIPVYCDLSDYLEWNIFGDFVRNFLSKGRPAVLVALKGEIKDIREDIQTSRKLSGGLENP